MFIGEYTHSLDSKGRMAVPAKFRKDLTGGAIITKGLEHCLFVFSKSEWEILAKKILALPLVKADARAFSRLMLSGAAEAEIDQQGRILIPDYLRTYAGLSAKGGSASGGKKQVVVAGVYNRAEIWDAEAWKQYKAKTESSADEVAEKMGELGI
ncbi:MAG TPA: division/cell wall cluster transcriptional repressor MraZ [Candidatus Paceibacterota bacterium]